MKRVTFYLLSLLVCFASLNAQENLNNEAKLVTTAKIWGFLKYYHPQVAIGKFDWDRQLIGLLPKVYSAKSKEELSQVYLSWLNQLGEVKPCKSCLKKSKKEYFNKNFDLSWIQDLSLYTSELSERLIYIQHNRFQGENHYITSGLLNQAKIINEKEYTEIGFPSYDYRLLGLFRYWNIIEYFFPHKYLMNQKWDDVLKEMVLKMKEVSNIGEYHLVIKELIARLDDSHASIRFGSGGKLDVPFKFNIIDNKLVIKEFYNDSIAKLNGIQIGDEITKINGINTFSLLEKELGFVSGSNDYMKRKSAYRRVFSKLNDTIKVEIKRSGKLITKTIPNNYYYHSRTNHEKWKTINDIGYINVDNLKNDDLSLMWSELIKTNGLIIDMRGYPRISRYKIGNKITKENALFVNHIIPDISYPGKFVWKNNKHNKCCAKIKDKYTGKVILLVDDNSISKSEFHIMAFQTAPKVITIGSQTAGADGDPVIFKYMGGYKTSFTGKGVFYPDGTQTQRVGVKIDKEVKPTIKGLDEGRDEVLEKAIEILTNN